MYRRKFGVARDDVTCDWRKLQNEQIHNLPLQPYSVTVRWVRHLECVGITQYAYRI
jgi:hypothetical protein